MFNRGFDNGSILHVSEADDGMLDFRLVLRKPLGRIPRF